MLTLSEFPKRALLFTKDDPLAVEANILAKAG